MSAQFSFQPDFRPSLPQIDAPKEFLKKRTLYEAIDDMLRRSGADERFVSLAVAEAEASGEASEGSMLNPKFLEHSFRALRCNIVRFIEKDMPLRELSNTLADSKLQALSVVLPYREVWQHQGSVQEHPRALPELGQQRES